MNAEPTIICPKCKAEIKLTESLAAPLLEAIRRAHERSLPTVIDARFHGRCLAPANGLGYICLPGNPMN